MYPTSIEDDVRSIVAAAINAPRLDALAPAAPLAELGFRIDRFMAQLGLRGEEAAVPEGATLADLGRLLAGRSEATRARAWELATQARLQRLLQGTLLATAQEPPPYDDRQRWWLELATQILWWFARQDTVEGMRLARGGTPARALQSLSALGMLELEVLAEGSDATARTMLDALKRCDYPDAVAEDAYVALVRIARKVTGQYDGRLQNLLRQPSEQLAGAVSRELFSGIEASPHLTGAVRMWISNATGLPLAVWSPSTAQFVAKFTDVRVSDEMLARTADIVGLPTVDGALTEFMDGLCRACELGNPEHQYCVKRFAGLGLQVECLARPDLAARHYL